MTEISNERPYEFKDSIIKIERLMYMNNQEEARKLRLEGVE